MTYLPGSAVKHDGDTWKVIGVGATRSDGKTMFHLASTTRGRQQKNGFNPIQVCDWIDPSELVAT